MLIRPLQIRDIFTISRMYLSLSEEDRRLFHPFPFRWWIIVPVATLFSIGPTAGKFIRVIFPRGVFLPVIAIETVTDRCAGFAYLQMKSRGSDNRYIATLGIVVDDRYKNKGIGSQMMIELIRQADKDNVFKIVLTVLVDNEPAIRLYQEHGFNIIKTEDNKEFWNGRFYPRHEMELVLNESRGHQQ